MWTLVKPRARNLMQKVGSWSPYSRFPWDNSDGRDVLVMNF